MTEAIGQAASSSERLECALTGRLGVAAVRKITLSPLTDGLVEQFEDLAVRNVRPERLALLRTKFKPGRKLTAYYKVLPSETDKEPHHIAVTWAIDGVTTVQVAPRDPTMPQLRRLTSREQVLTMLCHLGERGSVNPHQVTIRTVRYRPGQRHVLHVQPAQGRRGYFVKTDRDDSGARSVPVAEVLADTVARTSPRARLVDPAGYVPENRAAVWHEAGGEPLSQRLRVRPASPHYVRVVGMAVRAMHDFSPQPLGHGQAAFDSIASHDVHAEVATTLRAGEHIAALMPGFGVRYRELTSEILEVLGRWPGEPPAISHGDLKCDNILVAGHNVRLLDLDRVCWADPALDLGKFLADLQWWCRSAKDCGRAVSAFQAGYGPCGRERWARAALMASLFQLKFAARRCHIHDPAWARSVQGLLSDSAAALATARSV